MYDDSGTDAGRIFDQTTGKPRMLTEQCSTCIYRPGNLMRLRRGRLRQISEDARRADSFITCHQTIHGAPTPPAICRGFADRFSTNFLRIMERLGGFTEVDPPVQDGGHDATP